VGGGAGGSTYIPQATKLQDWKGEEWGQMIWKIEVVGDRSAHVTTQRIILAKWCLAQFQILFSRFEIVNYGVYN